MNVKVSGPFDMLWFSFKDGSHSLVNTATGEERKLSPAEYLTVLRTIERRDPRAAREMSAMDARISERLNRPTSIFGSVARGDA